MGVGDVTGVGKGGPGMVWGLYRDDIGVTGVYVFLIFACEPESFDSQLRNAFKY